MWALSAEMKGAAPDFGQLEAMFHQGEHQYEDVNEVRLCLTSLMSQRQADMYHWSVRIMVAIVSFKRKLKKNFIKIFF